MVGIFREKKADRRILTTDSGNFPGKIPEKKRKKKGTKKEQKRRIMCYNIIVQSCNLLWTA
jgi:hypothetical protein